MICNSCHKNNAIYDTYYGWLPCKDCQNRQAGLKKPSGDIPEFEGDSISEQRKACLGDIEPAHRKGVPSKEFRDRWGVKAMKRQGFTDKEIKNAKNVWDDNSYYKRGDN